MLKKRRRDKNLGRSVIELLHHQKESLLQNPILYIDNALLRPEISTEEERMNVEEEIQKLEEEIHRLGSLQTDGSYKVTFGVLFNDDRCANIFEALVGTLRAAKKRKIVAFEGELLLQGVHDKVEITLRPPPPPPQAAAATAASS
ncbi:Costars domain [Arabidopsis suecica]|uniref:Costars domain n=1 Tax=Arabidopsis suecica TaxID=45249 RepID=A0A8T1YGA0_ARASU|nr:Costars domain [Arabidopsis suecica]